MSRLVSDDVRNDCGHFTSSATTLLSMRKLKVAQNIPGGLQCTVCGDLLAEPIQSTCGERFCLDCFKSIVKGGRSACPGCGEQIDVKESWPDVFASKEIDKLLFHCNNHEAGCNYQGRKAELQIHMPHCSYNVVTCPNEGCNESVPCSDKAKHAASCKHRHILCSHCNQPIVVQSLHLHLKSCPYCPVRCPNGCLKEGQTIPQKDLPAHLESCPRRKDSCKVIGCNFKGYKDEMETHIESETRSHIEYINEAMVSVKQDVQSIENKIESQLRDQQQAQQASQDQIQTISQQTSHLEADINEAATQQKLMQQKTLEACYQAVDNLQKEMKQQLESFERHMRGLMEKCMKFEEIMATQSTTIQQLEEETTKKQDSNGMSEATQQQFQAQDRILASHDIKLAEHSLRLDMMDCKNTEGVLLWKITEIRRRRREAASGKTPSIYSQPFYTSSNGYKMCARLYLNGDGMGRGSHLSLFFVVMRGEYDSLLPWPFQQKVTLILIDQGGHRHISDTFRPDPSSSSFKRPRSEMNIASGCPLFVSLATLDGGEYITDDTLFIKMVVDASNLYRPDAR